MSDGAIREIVAAYTRESGVRVLERKLAALCRKAAMKLVDGACKAVTITEKDLRGLSGCAPLSTRSAQALAERVGVVNGLAWTSVGGELLEVEVNVVPGTGKVELTGNLGDVMKESAHAALSFIRSRAAQLGIDRRFLQEQGHPCPLPGGGGAQRTALPRASPSPRPCVSALTEYTGKAGTGHDRRSDAARPGAAHRRTEGKNHGGPAQRHHARCIIPADNEKDLEEIDQTVRAALQFYPGGAGGPGAGRSAVSVQHRL